MSNFNKGDRVLVTFSGIWESKFLEKGVRQGSVGKVLGTIEYKGYTFYRVSNPEWELGVRSFKAMSLTKF